MRKRRLLAAAAAFALAVGGMAPGAVAAVLSAEPEDAIAITEVTPFGIKVTGLAIEYSDEIDLGGLDIDESAFEITVALTAPGVDDIIGERTILKTYTNASPTFASAQTHGRYIILELDENEPTASASWYDGMFTQQYDLVGSHLVTQTKDLVGADGTLPAQPEISTPNSSVVNLIVDDYAADTLHAANGVVVPYRLFTPVLRSGETYPLVVTLHGHSESGTDNFAPITGNQISAAFANPVMQSANSPFVLSPQAGQSPPMGENGWWNANVQSAVIELVEEAIANNPQIDPDRVYLTGLSMGAFGSWVILAEHSGLFAGAILVCGAGEEDAAVPALGDFPIWALHSADDFVVPFDAPGSGLNIFRGFEAAGSPVIWTEWPGDAPLAEQRANAEDAWAAADEAGSNHIFTTFPEGTTPVMSHFSWVPTYSNDVILNWLFAQARAQVFDTVPAPTLVPSDQPGVEAVPELPTHTATPQVDPTSPEDDMQDTGVSGLPILAAIALVAIGAGVWLRKRAVQ